MERFLKTVGDAGNFVIQNDGLDRKIWCREDSMIGKWGFFKGLIPETIPAEKGLRKQLLVRLYLGDGQREGS